ncbi:GroES-like protein [Clavulina sp. PMI_390]|nr:GroES-like protein [Clavulina sp. PMI_390]
MQRALVLPSFPGTPIVHERPVPHDIGDDEILVKVHSAALNPVEIKMITLPWAVLSQVARIPGDGTTPLVLGVELAGEVLAVGKDVTHLKVGDHMCGQSSPATNDAAGYQEYSRFPAKFAIKVPKELSFDEAATLPVGFSTAAGGLYPTAAAGLTPPWAEGGKGKHAGQAAAVFGGSSVVGQFAIQLLRLSGFSPIIATSSAQHTDFLTSLGATHVVAHTTPASEITSLAGGTPISATILAITTLEHINTAIEVLTANAPSLPAGTSPILNISRPSTFLQTTTDLAAASPCVPPIQVSIMLGSPYLPRPGIAEFFVEAYAALQGYLTDGGENGSGNSILPCRPKVLDGGLEAVISKDGYGAFASGTVSGVKLVVHPHA